MINAGQPIAIPAYLNKLITKWRRASTQLEAKLRRPPTPEEMAKHLRISAKRAELVQQGLQAVTAPTQMQQESPRSLSESVSDASAPPDQALMDACNLPIVCSLLDKLGARERRILELRYGLDGYEGPPRTFKEIGAVIGLTRERVRQLEKKALADLRSLAGSLV
jgi:RNA polymerase primary sigma factor